MDTQTHITTAAPTAAVDLDLDLVLAAMPRRASTTREIFEAFQRRNYGHAATYEDVVAALVVLSATTQQRVTRSVDKARTIRFALRPVVDMACTVCFYTDRHAATVVAVSKSGHRVTTRDDKAIRTDGNGMSESQTYTYHRDPSGAERTFHRKADGTYGSGPHLVLGHRRSYHDFSF